MLIKHLSNKGAVINYYDPSGEKNEFNNMTNVSYCNDVKEACLNANLIVIHTEWDQFKTLDFRKLSKNKKVKIYDMRNIYSSKKMKKLGYSYYSVGR